MSCPSPELDSQASRELDEERRLHAGNVAAIAGDDAAAAVLRECDRHFDRVHEIMLAFTRRAADVPASQRPSVPASQRPSGRRRAPARGAR